MTAKIDKFLLILLTSALLPGRNFAATTVFQWTDEEGYVHFSDTAPAETTKADIREITFDDFDDNNNGNNDYTIIEQADQMAEWRRQITAERLARKKLHLEEKRINQEMELTRLNEMYMERGYSRPLTSFYAFPQPYLYHQRRYTGNRRGNQAYHRHFSRPPARAVPLEEPRPRNTRNTYRPGVGIGL